MAVTNHRDRRRPRVSRQTGFTLLELLVVLVIAAIAATVVSLSFRSSQENQIREEGVRLAELFDIASNEAQLRGHPLAWEAFAGGFRFREKVGSVWRPVADDMLGPRRWGSDVEGVTIDVPGSVGTLSAVVFGLESIPQPVRVRLTGNSGSVDIFASTQGHYEAR